MTFAVFQVIKNFFRKIIIKNTQIYQFYIKVRLFLNPNVRTTLAKKYLHGSGIEIGALHLPLLVPSRAQVKYVDRLSVSELRMQYPELKESPLVNVDIIDDGETLGKIKSDFLDFVIANHFLEHCENPIRAIESFLRVLKKGGILYLAVPDKRFTFDSDRPITHLEHLVKDYEQGPDWMRKEHFREWATFVDKKSGNELEGHIETLMNKKYSIHFHVWTYLELFELIVYLKQKLHFEFEVQEFVFTDSESIFVLKKT